MVKQSVYKTIIKSVNYYAIVNKNGFFHFLKKINVLIIHPRLLCIFLEAEKFRI